MLRSTKRWDIKCPDQLKELLWPRKGYWFKVNRDKAQLICNLLSAAYSIPDLRVMADQPSHGNYGEYCAGKLYMHGRAHIKTVFHEWYHHLDYCTRGKYNSDDRNGGASSYGWQFGDHMYAALKSNVICGYCRILLPTMRTECTCPDALLTNKSV